MEKKSLVSRQIIIVLYLIGAAIACIETTVQFKIGGFGNWKVYFFGAIFIFAVVMYFIRKKQRFQGNKTQE